MNATKSNCALGLLVLMFDGCAMQMVEKDAYDSCAKQGKKASIVNAKQSGIPLLIESASAMVMCLSASYITHLPAAFGAAAVSASNLGGVGIFAVTPGTIADKTGLKASDIVAEFGGHPVTLASDLPVAIDRVAAGTPAAVKPHRSSKELTLTAQL